MPLSQFRIDAVVFSVAFRHVAQMLQIRRRKAMPNKISRRNDSRKTFRVSSPKIQPHDITPSYYPFLRKRNRKLRRVRHGANNQPTTQNFICEAELVS